MRSCFSVDFENETYEYLTNLILRSKALHFFVIVSPFTIICINVVKLYSTNLASGCVRPSWSSNTVLFSRINKLIKKEDLRCNAMNLIDLFSELFNYVFNSMHIICVDAVHLNAMVFNCFILFISRFQWSIGWGLVTFHNEVMIYTTEVIMRACRLSRDWGNKWSKFFNISNYWS